MLYSWAFTVINMKWNTCKTINLCISNKQQNDGARYARFLRISTAGSSLTLFCFLLIAIF